MLVFVSFVSAFVVLHPQLRLFLWNQHSISIVFSRFSRECLISWLSLIDKSPAPSQVRAIDLFSYSGLEYCHWLFLLLYTTSNYSGNYLGPVLKIPYPGSDHFSQPLRPSPCSDYHYSSTCCQGLPNGFPSLTPMYYRQSGIYKTKSNHDTLLKSF